MQEAHCSRNSSCTETAVEGETEMIYSTSSSRWLPCPEQRTGVSDLVRSNKIREKLTFCLAAVQPLKAAAMSK